MAYDMNYLTNLITQNKGTGIGAALYNGFSGMGGGVGAGGYAGGVDHALRGAWGDNEAANWVNSLSDRSQGAYGNAMFDPSSGKYSFYDNGTINQGTLAGWDPSQYNAAGIAPSQYVTGSSNGGTGVGTASGFNAPPAGAGAPPATGGYAPPAGGGAPGGGYVPPAGGGAAGGGATAGSPFNFFNDEGYQFLKKQGMDGIQGSAAANGSLQSGRTLKDLASFNSGLASQEYGKAFDRFTNARNFNEDVSRDQRNFGRSVYQNDRDYGRDVYRDDRDYGRSVYRDDRDFSENGRRYNQGFDESQRRDARDFDYRSGLDDRNFDYGVQKDNRDFGYGAMTNDRNYTTGILDRLAGLGLGGSQGSSQLAQFLASLQSGNTMGGAGAGAAGTMGGANSTNAMISQLMQYLQSQQMMGAFGRNP